MIFDPEFKRENMRGGGGKRKGKVNEKKEF